MILFIVLALVVLITFAILGGLFYMLSKEGSDKNEDKAVPLTDLNQFKKELSETVVLSPLPSMEPSVDEMAYKNRVAELENELESIALKAEDQTREANKLIETLSAENEALKTDKAGVEEAQQKLAELQGEASTLKVDNLNLQTQLETSGARVRLLEEQMDVVKMQMGEELARANAAISELTHEKEAVVSPVKQEVDLGASQELDVLKSEQIALKQKCENLEKENQSLEYELIKARAQSSGLERISFNYKNQLEDFLKKVNAIEAINVDLSQVKNSLEEMVEHVKSENEDLVRKDQLSQFELEKNRSRLANLERECEDLKARTIQKDVQS